MAFYNEIEPFAADWLANLSAAGLVAPRIVDRRSIRRSARVRRASSASDQAGRDRLGREPTPSQATCSSLRIAIPQAGESVPCGQHPEPGARRRTHTQPGPMGSSCGIESGFLREVALPWSSPGRSLPVSVVVHEMFGPISPDSRAGISGSRAICFPAQDGAGRKSRRPDSGAQKRVHQVHAFCAIAPCICRNNTYGECETQGTPCHTRRIVVDHPCSTCSTSSRGCQ